MEKTQASISQIKQILFLEIGKLINVKNKIRDLNIIIKSIHTTIKSLAELKRTCDDCNKDSSYIDKIIEELKLKISELSIELENLEKSYDSETEKRYRTILSSLKFNTLISDENIQFVFDLFKKREISNINRLKMFELLSIHNHKINNNYFERSSSFYNLFLLSTGYEIFTEPNLDDKIKTRLNSDKEVLRQLIVNKENDYNAIKEILESYKVRFEDSRQFEYLLVGLLYYYQQKIYEQIELLSDEECYFDKDFKDLIKREYINYTIIYGIIRDVYDIPMVETMSDKDSDFNEKKSLKKILLYSRKSNGKSYIFSDIKLKGFPEQYYDKVTYLINGFKSDELSPSEMKILKNDSENNGIIELRKDQIRIFLRNIHSNYYCVLGARVKKANYDRTIYNSMCERPLITGKDISDEEVISQYIEKELIEYCNTHSRVGNR